MKTTSLVATSALVATGYSQWTLLSDASSGTEKFSLQQIRNEKFAGVNPAEALLTAFSRYAPSLPLHLESVLDLQPSLKLKLFPSPDEDSDVVSAEAAPPPGLDLEYVLPVSLGTPPQTLPLNLDTGSSDLWVFSTDTPSDEVNGQALYRPQNSSTSKVLQGASWQVRYGDGSGANGTVYLDRAAIGPLGFDQQAIQVATSLSPNIASDNFISGIMGMASSNANTVSPQRQRTFLDNIKDNLAQPLFTANLQKGMPGSYNFGYIDDSEYIGPIAYTPINPNTTYWEVQLDGYQLGKAGELNQMPIRGIVDTGTSLMLLPQNIVDDFYKQLPGSRFDVGSGTMAYPCNLTPPDFIFGIGSYRGIIPGHYLNYGQVTGGYCSGGLQSSANIPFSVFGDTLLKAQFVVFDRGNLAVGFANKKTVPPSN